MEETTIIDTRPAFSGQFMQQVTPENWRYDPTMPVQQVLPGNQVSNPAQPLQAMPGTFPSPGNSPGDFGRNTLSLVCTRCGGLLGPNDTFCGNCGLPTKLQHADGDTPTFMR